MAPELGVPASSPRARPEGTETGARVVEPLTRAEFLRTAAGKGSLAVAAFVLGLGVDEGWARAVRGPRLERVEYPKMVLGRYRVHHNVVGYLAIVTGVFAFPLLLIPLGVGMIVGHRRRDRLIWFIERVHVQAPR